MTSPPDSRPDGTASPDARSEAGENAATRTTSASLLRGGAWTTVAYVLPQIFTLVISVAAARFLGPTDMGRQSYISFIATSLAVCLSLGLPLAVQRFIGTTVGAGRPGQARALAAWAGKWGLAAAALGFAVVASMRFVTYPDLGTAWTLAAIYTATAILHSLAAQVLYGLQQWRLASVFGVATGALTVVTTLGVLSLGYGITGMFAAEAASALLSLAATAWFARRALRRLGAPAEPLEQLPGQVLRFAGVASLGIALDVFLNRRSEFFFLQAFSTDEEIAIYSIAFGVVAATARVPQAVVAVVMPAVATLAGAGQLDRIRTGYVRAMRLMVHLSLPLAVAAIALGPLAVRLVYGQEYEAAGLVLVAAAPIPLILSPLSAVGSGVLVGLGHLRITLLCGVAGLVANVALDLTLIPRFDALGAALANSGGQLVAAGLIIAAATRQLAASWWSARLLRSALAAALAGAGAAATAAAAAPLGEGTALALGSAAGVIAYLISGMSLRVLGVDEAEMLQGALGPRLRGAARLVSAMAERT